MRIDEILQSKRTLSFEVFPPKREDADAEKIFATVKELAALSPDFISVTYGAGGSEAGRTAEVAAYIERLGIPALAHITGGTSSSEKVDALADELLRHGVQNVLALRGDKPEEGTLAFGKDFPHATDLMRRLSPRGFTLGAACYPEGHTECESLYADLCYMKLKEECGAKFFITQLFYDNAYYYRLVHEARKIGVRSPILPGVMPLVSAKNIPRIKNMCGAALPLDFRNMLEIYSSRPAVMRELGLNYAVYQITDLIAKGAPGVHLYVMNNVSVAREIFARLRNIIHEFF